MRKILFFIIVCLLFFSAPLFSRYKVYAVCSISVSPPTFPYDFNGGITITSATDCFLANTRYTILGYPELKDSQPHLYSNYSVDRKNPSDTKTILANLNLTYNSIGRNNPGAWIINVCIANTTSECGQRNNILGASYITVSSPPAPTISQSLPMVDLNAQIQCTFQAGSEVVIRKITSIQPSTSYRWWWDGDWGTKEGPSSDANGSDTSMTIPGSETNRAGTRKFCIDIAGIAPGRGCSQNSIFLTFTAGPPSGNTSCLPTNAGNVTTAPLPPVCTGGLCNTAIGPIPYAPEGFIKTIFGIILGLAGGIALLLIIFSGYKLMTSQGNPEKVQGAKETLTSAIVGLLFIIFSLVILQIIGFEILKIPGFQ